MKCLITGGADGLGKCLAEIFFKIPALLLGELLEYESGPPTRHTLGVERPLFMWLVARLCSPSRARD